MRPDHYRCADGQGFDQVLPAERQQAPPHERDVRRCVVRLHLAHRVAEDDADVGGNRRAALAAPDERHTARGEQLGDRREALRMPGHEHEQGVAGKLSPRERIEQQRFLALARARREPDRARCAEARAEACPQFQRRRRDCDVELEVTGDNRLRRTELGESRRVGRRLRRDPRKAAQHRPDQGLEAPVPTRGALGEPGIDQEQRHSRRVCRSDQVRPQLGLEDESGGRPEVLVERIHGKRHVIRQPCLDHVIAEQRLSRFAARGGHVGEQECSARVCGLKPLHQRCRRARLADRHGVDPIHRARLAAVVASKALADLPAVTRLLAPAPPQAQRQQRQRG